MSGTLKTKHNKSEWFSSGVTSIRGKADEDNDATYIHDGCNAAFGVFDGHGGKYGSTLCSKSFCETSMDTVEKLKTNYLMKIGDSAGLNGDGYNAIFCESIRLASENLDTEIKRQGKSGTTATAVFAQIAESGRINIRCANIGDSRAILIRRDDILFLSEDHNLKLQREVDRIVQKKDAVWYPLPGDVVPLSTRTVIEDDLNASLHLDAPVRDMISYPSHDRLQQARELITDLVTVNSAIKPDIDNKARLQSMKISLNSDFSSSGSISRCDEESHHTGFNRVEVFDSDTSNRHVPDLTTHAHHTSVMFNVDENDADDKNESGDGLVDNGVSKQITSTTEKGNKVVHDIVKVLLTEIARVYDTEKVRYWEPQSRAFDSIVLVCVISEDLLGSEISLSDGLVGECYLNMTTVHSSDTRKEVHRDRMLDDRDPTKLAHMDGEVCVPLLHPTSGDVLGVAQIFSKESKDGLGSQDISQLITMCEQTSHAFALQDALRNMRSLKRFKSGRSKCLSSPNEERDCHVVDTSEAVSSAAREKDKGGPVEVEDSDNEVNVIFNSPTTSPSETSRATAIVKSNSNYTDSFSSIIFAAPVSQTGCSSSNKAKNSFDQNSQAIASDEPSAQAAVPLVYKNSFIANRLVDRKSEQGTTSRLVGPKALFSRYNVTITMTRSVGDKYAARSCVCVPEMLALILEPQEYAR